MTSGDLSSLCRRATAVGGAAVGVCRCIADLSAVVRLPRLEPSRGSNGAIVKAIKDMLKMMDPLM